MAAIVSFVRLPPLLSPFPRLLAVAAIVLPYQLYCYLLSLQLLLYLLPAVLTITWRATPELLKSDATSPASIIFLLNLRVQWLSKGIARAWGAGSGSR
jgi:hypothetical protein